MRARTVVVGITTSAVSGIAGGMAAQGVWWPLVALLAVFGLALWRLRWLTKDVQRMDAETEKEGNRG